MIRGKSVSQSSVSAKIIRKNGQVEDLGVISYWSNSWIKRILFRFHKKLKKLNLLRRNF